MRRRRRILTLIVLVTATIGSAAEPGDEGRLTDPDAGIQSKIRRAERLGGIIFSLEDAATKAMAAAPAELLRQIGREIEPALAVNKSEHEWDVLFLRAGTRGLTLSWLGHVDGSKARVERLGAERFPSSTERRMYEARRTALAAAKRAGGPCRTDGTAVVVPGVDVSREGWLVYLLAKSDRAGEYVLSGHRKFTVSPDGLRVLEEQRISTRCLTSTVEAAPEGAKPAGLFASTAIDEVPLETHVFTALYSGLPFFVSTSSGMWRIDGRTISLMRPK
jgi:hypothetical protein